MPATSNMQLEPGELQVRRGYTVRAITGALASAVGAGSLFELRNIQQLGALSGEDVTKAIAVSRIRLRLLNANATAAIETLIRVDKVTGITTFGTGAASVDVPSRPRKTKQGGPLLPDIPASEVAARVAGTAVLTGGNGAAAGVAEPFDLLMAAAVTGGGPIVAETSWEPYDSLPLVLEGNEGLVVSTPGFTLSVASRLFVAIDFVR